MEDLPPRFNSAIFNSSAFQSGSAITKIDADRLYVPLSALGPSGSSSPGKIMVADSTGQIGVFKAAGGDLLTLTSTATNARSCVKFITDAAAWECGTRGSTAVYPNSFFLYNGGWRFIINSVGDTQITSNTVSSSKTTGALTVIGGIGCGGQITSDRVRIDSSGSHLSIVNGAQNGLIEVPGSVDILRLVRGNCINIGTNGTYIGSNSTRDPVCRLDLGETASNMTLSLFNNTTSYYGLSANNNLLQYSAFGGHTWYTACTNAFPIATSIMSLESNGVLTATNNIIANKGYFVKQGSFSSSGRTGNGLACHMVNSSFAELFAWDYTGSLWKDMKINNTMYVNGTNSFVQIGANPGNPVYPLSVSGNFTTSFGGSYGYLGASGAGSGTGTGSVPVTGYFQHRVWASEFNAFSDKRLKDNIIEMNEDDAIDFVRQVVPKHFNWKIDKNKQRCSGYIAQDVLRHGKFSELVSLGPDNDLEEEVDDDGFVSPAGHRFVVSYQNTVPVLHAALAAAFNQIDELRALLDMKSDKRLKKLIN